MKDVTVGISASESPDLERLGLLESHFQQVLGEILRCVLVTGGRLIYGGHVEPTGYTTVMANELQRYARRDQPLTVCLAWSVHRAMALTHVQASAREFGLHGRVVCLDVDGKEIDPTWDRGETPTLASTEETEKSLTSMREYIVGQSNGRILIGGKRTGFRGRIPGLMEEALLTLKARQPLFLAGGFGGVTQDIVRALGIDDGAWFPALSDASDEDDRLTTGRAELASMTSNPDWDGLGNGLDAEENRRLAAAHRPSDIAALFGLGLGRTLG